MPNHSISVHMKWFIEAQTDIIATETLEINIGHATELWLLCMEIWLKRFTLLLFLTLWYH